MKILKIYILATVVFLGLPGCFDEFLEQTPQGVESVETFYTTAENAEKAIVACYAPFHDPYMLSALFLGDMLGEDNLKGSSYGDNPFDLNAMINFEGYTAAIIPEIKWEYAYKSIFRADVAIQRIPDIEMDESRKESMLGEAYFLRGYMFFELAICFGNVPIITEPLEDYFITNNTTEEVWEQVEADLKEAIRLLPEKSEWPAKDIGRATKGAAQALLGKALLYQPKYDDAEQALKTVVESSEYSLEPDFGNIFSLEGENGSGSIFELQFAELGEQTIAGSDGNFLTVFQNPRKLAYGWGFNEGSFKLLDEFGYYAIDAETLQKISDYSLPGLNSDALATSVASLSGKQYNTHAELEVDLLPLFSDTDASSNTIIATRCAFKPTDPRFEHTLLFLGETADGLYIDPEVPGNEMYTGMYNRKAFFANLSSDWRLSPVNERIIRLADMYLMYAEAAARNGNTSEAKKYLKLVRDRASTAELTLADFPNYTNGKGVPYEDTQEDLIEAILNERRLELAFEHFRFFDLVRTGKAEEVLGERGYVEGIHNVWAIPQIDIDRSGGKLKQNNGY